MSMLTDPAAKYRALQPIKLADRRWPDRVIQKPPVWCSVDLRDGNQALIEPMDAARKMRLFEALVAIGFKEIEVGFPSASQTDFDFIRGLILEDKIPADVTIQVLTQARENLIRRTFDALEGAERAIVHLYHATAPVMRRVVFGMSEAEVIDKLALPHAALVKTLANDAPSTAWTFQYSPEMFSGTELAFSKRIVDAVTELWQPSPAHKCIINLPSTVEHSMPNVFADMIEWMHRNIERRDAVVLSVHPHNDRGTGAAAAEMAILAGADRVEGCLFGNGERTGNVDIVTLALNLYAQGIHPELDFSDIDGVRATAEQCTQLPVHPRHPYAGDLVYTSFSGSHQDAIRKAFSARQDGDVWEMPYLPIDPKDVGRSYEAIIRVNSQSGKGGICYLLEKDYGLTLPRRLQIELSQSVQAITDATGKEVVAEGIWRVFESTYLQAGEPLRYVSHTAATLPATGQLELSLKLYDNERLIQVVCRGGGPLEAAVSGLAQHLALSLESFDSQEQFIGSGPNSSAVSYVELKHGAGRPLFGAGIDSDVVTAVIKSVFSAVNRLIARNAAAPGARHVA